MEGDKRTNQMAQIAPEFAGEEGGGETVRDVSVVITSPRRVSRSWCVNGRPLMYLPYSIRRRGWHRATYELGRIGGHGKLDAN